MVSFIQVQVQEVEMSVRLKAKIWTNGTNKYLDHICDLLQM